MNNETDARPDAPVMPALPIGLPTYDRLGVQTKAHYTAEQMHAYAREYAASLAAAPAEGVQPVALTCGYCGRCVAEGCIMGKRFSDCVREQSAAATPQAEAAGVPPECDIASPFNACQHRHYCRSLKAAARDSQAPAAPAAPVEEALREVVKQHDAWMASIAPAARSAIDDPLSDAIERARAALSRPQAEQEPT